MIHPISTFRRLVALVVLAACSSSGQDAPLAPPTAPLPATRAEASSLATVRWNEVARTLVSTNAPNQQAALRLFAYLSLAQYNALVGTPDLRQSIPAWQAGAVAGASAVVLREVFPGSEGVVADAVRRERDAIDPEWTDTFDAGESAGRGVAGSVVEHARSDRFAATFTGTIPTGEGVWFSSLNPPKPPVLPMLGKMRPFFLASGDQFRPAPPPAFGSEAYRTALAEVRRYSDTRTDEQLRSAQFWAMATGSLVAGYWNGVASELADRYHLSETRAAHELALLNMTVMDANIACHDAKYTYWMIRPSQADPGIKLAIGLPNHPSYPSNHSCDSGAAAYVLGALFPAERSGLEAQAWDASMSRVYAGLHYRFDLEAGLEIARKVSAAALAADVRGREPFPLRED